MSAVFKSAHVTQSAWEFERERIERSLTPADLLEEVGDACDELFEAVSTGDAALIGRVVLAARSAYLDRLADRVCELDARKVSAPEAARKVIDEFHIARAAKWGESANVQRLANIDRLCGVQVGAV